MGGAVWKAEDAADDLAPQLATRPAPLHGQRLWSGVGVSTLQQPAQFEGDSFEEARTRSPRRCSVVSPMKAPGAPPPRAPRSPIRNGRKWSPCAPGGTSVAEAVR